MICSQCQARNDDDSLFCANCGTSVSRPGPYRSQQQSTIRVDLGQGAPSSPGGYYDPRSPAGQYAPSTPSGRHVTGDPGNGYSQPSPYPQPSPPGPYSAPANPYSNGGQYSAGTPGERNPGGAPVPARAFNLDLRRLSRVEQTVGGASLVLLISLFLPWFGFGGFGSTFTISGTSAHGYLVIDVILVVLLIAYLVLKSGWDEFPVSLPIAHAPLLLIGTGLQFLLVVIGFFDKPSGLSWEIGAYLGLIAAAVAAGPVVIPAIRSWQGSR
jgi:hypothetical protein